jgi:hypothetical protein
MGEIEGMRKMGELRGMEKLEELREYFFPILLTFPTFSIFLTSLTLLTFLIFPTSATSLGLLPSTLCLPLSHQIR